MNAVILAIFFLLYLIQGIPYGFQSRFLPIYLRTQGLSLTALSAFKLLYLPWLCKTLIAPFIDNYWNKRAWLQISIFGLAFTCFILACNYAMYMPVLIVSLFFLNLCAATQDVAVDSIVVSSLPRSHLGDGNVAQVVGYKIGAMIGGGILISLSDILSWSTLFISLGCIYLCGLVLVTVHSLFQPFRHISGQHSDSYINATYFVTLREALRVPCTKSLIGFLLVYKLGEQGILSMLPLYLVDKHTSLGNVGFWTGVVGQLVSVCGSAVGGRFFKLLNSTYKAVFILVLVRIPVMIFLTILVSPAYENYNFSFVFEASIFLMNLLLFISGMVTTVTFTFMMECSQRAPHGLQATHYTALSTMEVFGKLLFSTLSGGIVDYIGYYSSYVLFTSMSAITPLYLIIMRVYLNR